MANTSSRRGIGVVRSDYDVVTDAFRSADVPFGESVSKVGEYTYYPSVGRRKVRIVAFETTALFFDLKGRYLGREYMSRDECDYFEPRDGGAREP